MFTLDHVSNEFVKLFIFVFFNIFFLIFNIKTGFSTHVFKHTASLIEIWTQINLESTIEIALSGTITVHYKSAISFNTVQCFDKFIELRKRKFFQPVGAAKHNVIFQHKDALYMCVWLCSNK